jgi:hypothetical protein
MQPAAAASTKPRFNEAMTSSQACIHFYGENWRFALVFRGNLLGHFYMEDWREGFKKYYLPDCRAFTS